MKAAGAGVLVNVAVGVFVGLLVRVGVFVKVGVLVNVGVRVGVCVLRSGSVIVCSSKIAVPCTVARILTVLPCFAWSYLMHDRASPGCGTIEKLSVHGAD